MIVFQNFKNSEKIPGYPWDVPVLTLIIIYFTPNMGGPKNVLEFFKNFSSFWNQSWIWIFMLVWAQISTIKDSITQDFDFLSFFRKFWLFYFYATSAIFAALKTGTTWSVPLIKTAKIFKCKKFFLKKYLFFTFYDCLRL